MTLRLRLLASIGSLSLLAAPGLAHAQDPGDVTAQLRRLESLIAEQSRRLSEQQRLLTDQKAVLDAQRAELDRLTRVTEEALASAVGTGPADPGAPILLAQATPVVGVAPPDTNVSSQKVEIASMPEGTGVLTPKGRFVLDPSLDYTHGSSNRLVFRGIEIVTGVQIGVIEASDADRNAASGALALRYGLTNRLEIEARVPYIYRADRITTLVQMEDAATRTFNLKGHHLGDVEMSARYQLNSGQNGRPILIAGLRAKSDTGTSPFEIDRDEFGIANELATGSGFWGVETSLNFIYPTDPAVIFGGISYLTHVPKDIDRDIGGVLVGRVDPGDSATASAGFGFALNPRFSFSLGYRHSYIFPTKSELGTTLQRSESLQVGGFSLGWSFQLNERVTLSNTYEIGTTSDSPDMRIVFRLPIRF